MFHEMLYTKLEELYAQSVSKYMYEMNTTGSSDEHSPHSSMV